MKRVVNVVQGVALLCTLAFAVLLFANEPDDAGAGGADVVATSDTTVVLSGEAVYANRCAGCHGGDGSGGLGPQLSGGRMVAEFPDIADQIAVITKGRGGMPGFGDKLSAAEIAAVAEYERSL
jgi:mono/diheme cytochrome c family protein